MENQHFQWVIQLYIAIFNSYVKLPEDKGSLPVLMMRVMVRNWITLYNRSLDVCVQTCGAQTLFSNLKWTMKWCSFAVLIEHTST